MNTLRVMMMMRMMMMILWTPLEDVVGLVNLNVAGQDLKKNG
jgi:hypothetical protein